MQRCTQPCTGAPPAPPFTHTSPIISKFKRNKQNNYTCLLHTLFSPLPPSSLSPPVISGKEPRAIMLQPSHISRFYFGAVFPFRAVPALEPALSKSLFMPDAERLRVLLISCMFCNSAPSACWLALNHTKNTSQSRIKTASQSRTKIISNL
jgi:hypothetical protein